MYYRADEYTTVFYTKWLNREIAQWVHRKLSIQRPTATYKMNYYNTIIIIILRHVKISVLAMKIILI